MLVLKGTWSSSGPPAIQTISIRISKNTSQVRFFSSGKKGQKWNKNSHLCREESKLLATLLPLKRETILTYPSIYLFVDLKKKCTTWKSQVKFYLGPTLMPLKRETILTYPSIHLFADLCKLSFIWGWMRTTAWELAFQIALKTTQRGRGEGQCICAFVKGGLNVVKHIFCRFLFCFLNYENMITHLQETWKIQSKVTYSSTIQLFFK